MGEGKKERREEKRGDQKETSGLNPKLGGAPRNGVLRHDSPFRNPTVPTLMSGLYFINKKF